MLVHTIYFIVNTLSEVPGSSLFAFCFSENLDKSPNYFEIEGYREKVTNILKYLSTMEWFFCIIEKKHLRYLSEKLPDSDYLVQNVTWAWFTGKEIV